MRPVDWKLARSVASILLPTLAVVAFGVHFLVSDVPQIVRDERARVHAETEAVARELRDNEASTVDFVWERGKGIVWGDTSWASEFPPDMTWKAWNSNRTARTKDNMWGWRTAGEGRLVWARGRGKGRDTMVFARVVGINERDYAATLYAFVPLVLAVLVGMTAFGVKYFVDYGRSRDDFLAATAHDLTTPLAAMRFMIGRDDATARTLNERMLRLVANIKDFMRLGGRRPRPEANPFDLVKAYDEAYSLFRADYRDAFDGADVPLDLSAFSADGGMGRPLALGDETLTVQILWNLLGNDLKYAAPFGPVRVAMRAEDGFAKVEFADEGHGMTTREMARAFDRYYRAKTVLVSGKGGFGIGLTTAREFAARMGGSLTVKANEPTGCVFTLALPLAQES